MRPFSVGRVALLAVVLVGCGDQPMSVKLCPAARAAPEAEPEAGWVRVEFSGNPRSAAGIYHVRQTPVLTEWNILEFRDAGEEAIAVRLNAYGVKRMKEFSGDPANLKKPLGININGRWAHFMPLLAETGDRMLLYGFTREEKAQLADYIKNR